MSTSSAIDVVLTTPPPPPPVEAETSPPPPEAAEPEGDNGQQKQQQSGQQPRKKKITRLIPAEESLAVITEEHTELSEDSSSSLRFVSDAAGGITREAAPLSPPAPSKISAFLNNLPNVLGEKPLSEASLHSMEAREEALKASVDLNQAAAELNIMGWSTTNNNNNNSGNGENFKKPGDESSSDTAATEKTDPADESDLKSEQTKAFTTATEPLPNGVAVSPSSSSYGAADEPDAAQQEPHASHQQQSIPRDPPPTATFNHHNDGNDARYPHHTYEQVSDVVQDDEDDNDDEEEEDEASNDGVGASSTLSASGSGDEGGGGGRGATRRPSMFDFDDMGDEFMDAPEEKEELLTWRLDPAQSLSDWTIVVKSKVNNDSSDKYHVHKNILAVGPRKSDYFVKEFRSSARTGVGGDDQSTSPLPSTTEVVLPDVAANAFPQLLDFMYSVDGDVDITSALACGLRHLTQFFGVRALHKRVMDFIKKDLTMRTVVTYYSDVSALRDDKMLHSIAKFCSKNIMKIDVSFPLLDAMDPYFFSKLLSSEFINTKEKRYHCSLLVADFCKRNKQRLDSKRFLMLTEEASLPLVHHSVSLTLMEIEVDVVAATATESLTEMTSLQKRCVKELSSHWRELLEMDTPVITRVCRKLPSCVVTDLLVQSLAKAKRKLHEPGDINADASFARLTSSCSNFETSSRHSASSKSTRRDKHQEKLEVEGKRKKESPSSREIRKEYEAKVELVKQEHFEELVRLKKEYETNLVRLRDMLVDKDKTISRFWNEIKSFERLPNNHDGKLVASGRLHEASYIPEVRATTVDGYLFVAKKGGPNAKYPLFYYKKEERDRSDASSQTR